MVDYHPYWLKDGTKNPNVDKNSKAIMSLKTPKKEDEEWKIQKHRAAIKLFTRLLQQALNDKLEDIDFIQIAIVPSSTAGKISDGLRAIVKSLNTKVTVIFDEKFLVRTRSVTKAHEGGDRSINKHLDTIQVETIPSPDIPILLLDDVTTTGNSLNASRDLLNAAGCKNIIMLAIGQTVETNE